jgi:hypothetical protein
LQEDFIVDGGVEDSSTVSLIQLEEETVERGIVALDTQKGPGPDTFTDSENDFAGCKEVVYCFV